MAHSRLSWTVVIFLLAIPLGFINIINIYFDIFNIYYTRRIVEGFHAIGILIILTNINSIIFKNYVLYNIVLALFFGIVLIFDVFAENSKFFYTPLLFLVVISGYYFDRGREV